MITSSSYRVSRRRFLATTSLALAAPGFLAASAKGQETRPAPSGRIVMGVVGCGGMGNGNTDNFLGRRIARSWPPAMWTRTIWPTWSKRSTATTKNTDCKAYHDFRELMARDGY